MAIINATQHNTPDIGPNLVGAWQVNGNNPNDPYVLFSKEFGHRWFKVPNKENKKVWFIKSDARDIVITMSVGEDYYLCFIHKVAIAEFKKLYVAGEVDWMDADELRIELDHPNPFIAIHNELLELAACGRLV